jgi:ferredoxin
MLFRGGPSELLFRRAGYENSMVAYHAQLLRFLAEPDSSQFYSRIGGLDIAVVENERSSSISTGLVFAGFELREQDCENLGECRTCRGRRLWGLALMVS